MKRRILLSCVLALFVVSIAVAEEVADKPAAPADSATAVPGAEAGRCVAESEEVASLAAPELDKEGLLTAGFEVRADAASWSACPTTQSCTNLSGCSDTTNCNSVDTGDQCCIRNGRTLCCVIGTIHKNYCDCGFTCNPYCPLCPNQVLRSFSCQ